jgi:hypothetical protein
MDSQSKKILWAHCREMKELLREIRLAKPLEQPSRKVVRALVAHLEDNLSKLSDEYGREVDDETGNA